MVIKRNPNTQINQMNQSNTNVNSMSAVPNSKYMASFNDRSSAVHTSATDHSHYTQNCLHAHDQSSSNASFAATSVNLTAAHYSSHVNLLARYILDGDYLNAISIIKRDPERASTTRFVAHEFMGGHRDSDVLPIHMALSQGDVPMELIQALLIANPGSIHKKETGYGRNCVHIALKSFVSDSITSYLIQLNPKACQEQDKLGRLPLHYAVSNLHSFDIMNEILTVYPEAVKSWDNLGWTALHIACQTYSSLEVIEALLSRNPEAVLMETKRGSTPLDIAYNSKTNNKENVIPVLEPVDAAYRNLPFIQNYRAAVAKNIYRGHKYMPPVCHNIT